MRNIAVSTKNLTKIYQGKILANDKINLDIFEGEIFGLLGPNGAGKTTFIRQILGLLFPTSGEIKIFDIDLNKNPQDVKKIINYMGQNPYALWHLTVEEAIFYTAYLKDVPKLQAKKITDNLIEKLNLKENRKKLLGELSGGTLRLANFAMAISSPCKILVLDEPTAGLDPVNKKMVWDKIFNLNKEDKITVILATHDVLEAEKVLQRVAFINHSKVIALGTPGELKREVDDRLRIELVLKENYTLNEAQKNEIKKIGELIELYKNHLVVFPEKIKATSSLDKLVFLVDINKIDDIRLTTTSLEDVYIKLGKEKFV